MRKRLLIVVVIVILILISSFLYFRTTPQYSLYQIAQAYKTRDLVLAKEYIDIDGLSDQVAEESIRELRQEMNKPSDSKNEWEQLGYEFGKSLVESMIPSLQQQIKDGFKKSFTESIEGKSDSNQNLPNFKPLGWRDFLPGGRIKINSAGAIRLLTIQSPKGDTLIFRMRNEDVKWKIVGWENFGDIAKNLTKDNINKENSKPNRNAKFGEKVSLADGWFLTVSAPEQYTPKNEFDRASSGNQFVIIEVVYDNSSGKDGTYDASNFELKDKADHRYKRKYSGREPQLDSSLLPASQKVKGYITYEVPTNEEVTTVIYSSQAGGTIIFSKVE